MWNSDSSRLSETVRPTALDQKMAACEAGRANRLGEPQRELLVFAYFVDKT
jgi:hypothetical protein